MGCTVHALLGLELSDWRENYLISHLDNVVAIVAVVS